MKQYFITAYSFALFFSIGLNCLATDPKGLSLELNGVKYEEVTLTSFSGSRVGITHSNGVASIDLDKLKPQQIAALNATSTSVHIELDHFSKNEQQTDETIKSQTVTAIQENGAAQIAKLQETAQTGDAAAQYSLGMRYLRGDGVPQDLVEMVKWFRKSAEQGYPQAQVQFARCYLDGDGVPREPTEGVKWLRKAAQQKYIDGELQLAHCYATGNGVPVNDVEAGGWLQQAADQGSEEAKNLLYARWLKQQMRQAGSASGETN